LQQQLRRHLETLPVDDDREKRSDDDDSNNNVDFDIGVTWWALILAIFGSAALCGFAGYFFICRRMQARSRSEDFTSKVITAPDTPWIQPGNRSHHQQHRSGGSGGGGGESNSMANSLNAIGGNGIGGNGRNGTMHGGGGGGGGGEGGSGSMEGGHGAAASTFAQMTTPAVDYLGQELRQSASQLSNSGPRDFRQALMHDDDEARDILMRSRVLYDDQQQVDNQTNHSHSQNQNQDQNQNIAFLLSHHSLLPRGGADGDYEAMSPAGGSNAQLTF
jgi:hypothetical protein